MHRVDLPSFWAHFVLLASAVHALAASPTTYPPPLVELYQPRPRTITSQRKFDVVVLGATPGGCAAAMAAARAGRSVALIEPSAHVGGMITGGLSRTDFGSKLSRGGMFDEFIGRIHDYYRHAYGPESPRVRECREGYYFEPKVASAVLWEMLDEFRIQSSGFRVQEQRRGRIDLFLRSELVHVLKRDDRVTGILVRDVPRVLRHQIAGNVFIDATYEADLAARAGADYRTGREDRAEFNEPHAGEILWDTRPYRIVGGSGRGDRKVQAYCYRLTLTRRPDLRVPIERPANYDRERYATLVPDVLSGWHKDWFTVMSILPLPNGKYDANNHPKGVPSTDLIEGANEYPEADYAMREVIARAHRDHALGLMYFLQNDPALPESFRTASREWGLCKDEFVDNDNFPTQLYVREARRIVGEYLFTENDLMTPNQTQRGAMGQRPKIHADAIAVGDYPTDSHATTRVDPQNPRLVEGFYFTPVNPYQIPYRLMLPQKVEGVLVVGGLSSTHVAYGTLRMEPVWMAVGQAAGWAADEAIAARTAPSKIRLDDLQLRLARHSQVLAVFTDLPRYHPYFEAVQFWAARGWFPTYEAQPEAPMTLALATEWTKQMLRHLRPQSVVLPESESTEPMTHAEFHEVLSKAKRALGSRTSKLPSALQTGEVTRAEACDALLQFYRTTGRVGK